MKFIISITLIIGTILLFSSCSMSNLNKGDKGIKTLGELHEYTGNWIGSGKIFSAPNQEGKQWTSIVNYNGAYDDILVQKKEIMDIGNGQPIATLSFLGWDWETSNPIIMTVANDGNGGNKNTMYKIGNNKYKVTNTTIDKQGKIIIEEVTTELNGNSYSVSQSRSVDGAVPFISLSGIYYRTPNDIDLDLRKVNSLVPLSEETKKISCMTGNYKQNGNYQGYPIDGDETIELILGGHAMFINFKFKEEAGNGYFGSSLTSWNNTKNRFTGFMISNDGMAATFEAWLSPDNSQLIYEPLDSNGVGQKDARWHAELNQDKHQCLLNVVSDKVAGSSNENNGLYIKFTKVESK